MTPSECRHLLRQMKVCVVVPTYNNRGTVLQVLDRLYPFVADIVVVNDGSTDGSDALLAAVEAPADTQLTLCSYTDNRGKGHALRTGFRRAIELGFDYAITIDSDGQHYPEDLPCFAACLQRVQQSGQERAASEVANPTVESSLPLLIVGNRKLQQDNMPGGNTFANYFSNFWFMIQTWQYLPDTQTGYRLYPLHRLHGLSLLTARYEAELELLVFAAWHGVRLVSTPIRVYYPPREERVTHFRPFWDFFRISVLNTVLCVLALCYGWWSMLWHRIVH